MNLGRNRTECGQCELQGVEWWHTDHDWERTDMGWPVVPWSLREILLYVQDSSIRHLSAEKLQVYYAINMLTSSYFYPLAPWHQPIC